MSLSCRAPLRSFPSTALHIVIAFLVSKQTAATKSIGISACMLGQHRAFQVWHGRHARDKYVSASASLCIWLLFFFFVTFCFRFFNISSPSFASFISSQKLYALWAVHCKYLLSLMAMAQAPLGNPLIGWKQQNRTAVPTYLKVPMKELRWLSGLRRHNLYCQRAQVLVLRGVALYLGGTTGCALRSSWCL